MKTKLFKKFIKTIIQETLQVLNESEIGEWWIYPGGHAEYANGDVGDMNHEGFVIQYLSREIYEHFVGTQVTKWDH